MTRTVTERDFRIPEFYDAEPKDYEFRSDGKLVRKDRWEEGIRSISYTVQINKGWEIPDITKEVVNLKMNSDRYIHLVTNMLSPTNISGGIASTLEELNNYIDADIELKRAEDENS